MNALKNRLQSHNSKVAFSKNIAATVVVVDAAVILGVQVND